MATVWGLREEKHDLHDRALGVILVWTEPIGNRQGLAAPRHHVWEQHVLDQVERLSVGEGRHVATRGTRDLLARPLRQLPARRLTCTHLNGFAGKERHVPAHLFDRFLCW